MSNSLDAIPLVQRRPLRISTDIPLFSRSSSASSSSSSSPTNQNVTPGTTPSTGSPECFFHVLCMHDFESSDPVQLPFHRGEVLTIIKQEYSGWWAAMRHQGDRIGWIPSSFVRPASRSKFVECPDETLATWAYESLNDPPLSALHDPWVPVSEDYTALTFRLVTPTDLVPNKGFFDDRVHIHGHESSYGPSNYEQSPDMENVSVPPTPMSPPPCRNKPYPSNHLPSAPGALQFDRRASFQSINAALHLHSRPYRVSDQASLLYPTTPISSELTSGLGTEESLVVFKPVSSFQDNHSEDGQSKRLRMPTALRSARSVQSTSKFKLLDLRIWGPNNLAEQLCVVMHSLYIPIRQSDCLEWMMEHRSTSMTGLRHFFDIHDYIASWVHQSILVDDDTTRHAETLDFWIRVAEECHALRNFDSLCGIILALSEPHLSSLVARCAQKQTLVMLHGMLDVSKGFGGFVDIMDATKGPSVPFVRGYLDHIKDHVGHSNSSPDHSGRSAHAALSVAPCRIAVSALLRHQSSPYDFKVTKSIRSFIDELQTGRW